MVERREKSWEEHNGQDVNSEKKFKLPQFVAVYSEIVDENYGFEGFAIGSDGLHHAR
jgi:hypothetical protein